MVCKECYWCALNKPIGNEMVCCNQESENYNKIFIYFSNFYWSIYDSISSMDYS